MEIKGTVVRKIYEGANGYAVVEIEGDEPTVVVGTMPYIKRGELTRFSGSFEISPKYGRQFACETYESIQPVEKNAMVRFLESDFVKGVGHELAARLVETFGEDTFKVIEEDPEQLTRVKGISLKRAQDLHDTFREYAESKTRYAELMGLGLTARQAGEAAKTFGGDAVEKIKKDPYCLIEAVSGVEFATADKIAKGLGIEADSPIRLERAVMNVLRKSQLECGHMCVSRGSIILTLKNNLEVGSQLVEEALMRLAGTGDIVLRKNPGMTSEAVFMKHAYETERETALLLTKLASTAPPGFREEPAHLAQIAKREHLSDEQIRAVEGTWDNSVCVITGGPGTGKTTIVKAAIEMFTAAGKSFMLAAPTGRAAKRMQEATGQDAKTIHRLLEFTYDDEDAQGSFQINEDNPLDTDVVIVDEMSMVDAYLFRSLLRGVQEGTRLVLIGDADQLPSVGPGNVLRDLVRCRCLTTFELTHRYRNSGRIAEGAWQILQGRVPQFDSEEFVFRYCSETEDVAKEVQRVYVEALARGEDVQVIAPIKKSALGSVSLNNQLREAVNPKQEGKPEIQRGERIYRMGDRVMQIVNDYSREWENHARGEEGKGVFNGDIGVISSIVGSDVRVDFDDGRSTVYTTDEIDALDGAFAYTIHKSQGSEFESVILPMCYTLHSPFFSRSLLYTAVTRAKKKVTVIGRQACFNKMVYSDQRQARGTMLGRELRLLKQTMNRPAGPPA